MILNQQTKARVDLTQVRGFVARLRKALALGGCNFNVCFVDDARIRQFNTAYRHKSYSTDVLSFPWRMGTARVGVGSRDGAPSATRRREAKGVTHATGFARRTGVAGRCHPSRALDGFLGDIVISAETARRNAAAEGHAARTEICWLILHGLLHLLGYDHETDDGEMLALELAWRERLGV